MAEPTSKIRRLQAGAACDNCRRRRSRCDAVRPRCSNCQMRSISCEYPVDQPSKHAEQAAPKKSTAVPNIQPLARKQPCAGSNLNIANGRTTPGSLIGSLGRLSGNDLTTHTGQKRQTYSGISSTFDFTIDPCLKEVDAITTSYKQSRDWLNVIQPPSERESSGQMASIETYFEVPKRELADSLLDVYFRRTHRLYPFIHEGDFRAEYESMWRIDSGKDRRFPWLAVLNMVFAYGCEFCDSIPKGSALRAAKPYVARAKDIVFAHVLKANTLETIQALLLVCYYLQEIGELEECWNLAGLLTRTAQGLGLHVNPSADRFLPIERELRKRAWAGCLVLDRSLSLTCGRPPSLGVQKLSVDLPLEIDDQYIRNDTVSPRQPSGTPSMISFFVSTLRLSCIVSDVSTTLYLRDFDQSSTDTSLYGISQAGVARCNHVLSAVLLLDGQLQSWREHIPDHLKFEITDLDSSWIDMQSQRVALKANYLYVQLLIFRRTFLYFAQNAIESAFLRAVAASSARLAVQSACDLIDLISPSDPRQHLHSVLCNAQYVFASLCVLCVFETMDKDRRSLLDCQIDGTQTRECYRMGMELLHAADQSSELVVRFIAILERLRGDGISETWSNFLGKNVDGTYLPPESGYVEHAQHYEKAQGNTYPWATTALGPMLDTYIDFSDLDTFFTGFGNY